MLSHGERHNLGAKIDIVVATTVYALTDPKSRGNVYIFVHSGRKQKKEGKKAKKNKETLVKLVSYSAERQKMPHY